MLNRRHIRIKVMQAIYAMQKSGNDNLESQEKFLLASLENIQDLYLTIMSIFAELKKNETNHLELLRKKHLATPEERNPNTKFINNAVLTLLTDNESLNNALEARKIKTFQLKNDFILALLKDIKASELYAQYMNNATRSFEDDKLFVEQMFTELIASNDKLYEFVEEAKLTWVDDLPIVNTLILKQLKNIKNQEKSFYVPKLYKDLEDKEYARTLFRKTVLNNNELEKEFANKTNNWDADRIADLDAIILKMAICELLKFPSIPVKVTINEFLELAKEYSTKKSSIFINGILDNLVKDYTNDKRLIKTGRGLM
ncbi:transcription antitermination factor NusB [Flavobacterium agricola]|uniref:Transcription antitermination factor NusB n=1 Tax=Flavobacterium agricola TaxID=2870839 RepID=A0ABY6LZQ0_9FLAO|nr:transcription antitermination factor NusB [Flavobacterium agricola]UYW00373.1 transcription antitermination factor NusB [Flavobacterium agricola]